MNFKHLANYKVMIACTPAWLHQKGMAMIKVICIYRNKKVNIHFNVAFDNVYVQHRRAHEIYHKLQLYKDI